MLWPYARSRNKIYFLDMKKLSLILLIICLFNNYVNARNNVQEPYPKLTIGLEWGYIVSLNSIYHYNFYAPEGFRVDEKGSRWGFTSNADMYLNVGCNLTPEWNLSLYIGYAGVGDYHKILPISIRGTRYFGTDLTQDRWFAFADAGSGICLKTPVQEILTAKIGAGYEMSLSKDTKLNFIVSARSTYTHPGIQFDDHRIPMKNTNRNNAIVSALSFGLGLTF